MRTKLEKTAVPALAMRGVVVFPNIVMHFDVSREKSESALKAALKKDKMIYIATKRDYSEEEP